MLPLMVAFATINTSKIFSTIVQDLFGISTTHSPSRL